MKFGKLCSCLVLGAAVLYAVTRYIGQPVEEAG